jgi:hypothetical protein
MGGQGFRPLFFKQIQMHTITGFYFFSHKNGKKYVIYSTLYKLGRFASLHECTGMTDAQARGAFVIEHSREVDYLMKVKKQNDNKSKIILNP